MGKYYSEAGIYEILNDIIINIVRDSSEQLCKDLYENQNMTNSKVIIADVIKLNYFTKFN